MNLQSVDHNIPIEADESQMVMWEQVLSEPWHNFAREAKWQTRHLHDYGLDDPTWAFLDAVSWLRYCMKNRC